MDSEQTIPEPTDPNSSAVPKVVNGPIISSILSPQSPSLPLFRPAQLAHPVQSTSKPPTPKGDEMKAELGVALSTIDDAQTREAIIAVTNEHGLRAARKANEPVAPIASVAPTKKPPKKKPGPKPKATKRKIETPLNRSLTPVSKAPKSVGKRASTGPPMSKSPSPTDAQGDEDDGGDAMSVDGDDDEDEDDDDGAVYCLCKRPDDHTPMIACDGGCNNWFHYRCVGIHANDGKLIDQYICDNCQKKSKGKKVTTWKPMCRRDICRNPARVLASPPSTYCSDECGEKFMKQFIARSNKSYHQNLKQSLSRYPADATTQHLRGGPLNDQTLKALVMNIATAEKFRSLGEDPVSNIPQTLQTNITDPAISTALTVSERNELTAISAQKERVRADRAIVKDREILLSWVKDQVSEYVATEGLKPVNVCGYDARLSLNHAEFVRWKTSPPGIYAFEHKTLKPSSTSNGLTVIQDCIAQVDLTNSALNTSASGTDVSMSETRPENSTTTIEPSFCTNKRCGRHAYWQRTMLETLRFQNSELASEMREADSREREIRWRVLFRWLENNGNNFDYDTNGHVNEMIKTEVKMEIDETNEILI